MERNEVRCTAMASSVPFMNALRQSKVAKQDRPEQQTLVLYWQPGPFSCPIQGAYSQTRQSPGGRNAVSLMFKLWIMEIVLFGSSLIQTTRKLGFCCDTMQETATASRGVMFYISTLLFYTEIRSQTSYSVTV